MKGTIRPSECSSLRPGAVHAIVQCATGERPNPTFRCKTLWEQLPASPGARRAHGEVESRSNEQLGSTARLPSAAPPERPGLAPLRRGPSTRRSAAAHPHVVAVVASTSPEAPPAACGYRAPCPNVACALQLSAVLTQQTPPSTWPEARTWTHPPHAASPVLRIRSSAEFNGIAWSRLGSAPCNQIIASGFRAAGIKAFLPLFYSFRPPRLHSAVVARLEAAPAWRSVPHSFTRHFRPPRPPRTVITINSSQWRGLKRESEHRLEPMEGVDFFQKSLRSLRSRIQIIGLNRYAGPNRSTAPHPPHTHKILRARPHQGHRSGGLGVLRSAPPKRTGVLEVGSSQSGK